MKIIKANFQEVDYKELVKRSALLSDVQELVTEDCKVVDENGKTLILYKELKEDTKDILWALQTINYGTNTRTNGLKTTSAIFGYSPRNAIRRDYCTATAMSKNQPKQHNILLKFGKKLSKLYEEFIPEVYSNHLEVSKSKIKPSWMIPETPFTSGIVNKNNPLKYHFDSGNFKDVYSNMIVFKYGVAGGFLNCPELGLAFEVKNNTVIFFDGQKILHGVTPIQQLVPDAFRYSVVYYTLQQMWNCETTEEELARIRAVKAQKEIKRIK